MDIQINKAFRVSPRVQLHTGEGLTEQSHKSQCDINHILRDYQRTGMIKHAKNNPGRYDDVSGADFESAMILVANAKSMFEGLPANLRSKFDNNPKTFLDFCQNPVNLPELNRMGIQRGVDGIDSSGAHLATYDAILASSPVDTPNEAE
jgi:hypothetical protein